MEEYINKLRNDMRGNGRKVRYKKEDGTTGYKIEKREQKRLSHEVVVSCGNTSYEKAADGTARFGSDKKHIRPQEVPPEVNYAVCRRYADTFEARNPNFKIISCDWNNDEGFFNKYNIWEYAISHIHLVFVAFGTGYKQGLEHHVSISKALENMGFKDIYEEVSDADGNIRREKICAYTLWEQRESEYLEELLHEEYRKYCKKNKAYFKEHGELEIIHPVKDRKVDSLAPAEYAEKQQLIEENADLTAERDELLEEISDLSNVEIKKEKGFFKKEKRYYMSEDEHERLLQRIETSDKLEGNSIKSDEYVQKTKKELEAAEDKRAAAENLFKNEKKYILEEAEKLAVKMAAEHKKALDEEYRRKKEKVLKKYRLLEAIIEKLTNKKVSTVITEFIESKRINQLQDTQNRDFSHIRSNDFNDDFQK